MRSDLPVVRLGDHCVKIGSGATPKGGKESYLDSGPYSLIRSQNVYNEGFAWRGLAYISEEQARRLDGVAVVAGDVLVNITGDSVARVCTAPEAAVPARVNQHVAIVRPCATSFDPNFLRWFLCTPEQQEKLLGLASAGATRNALTKAMLEGLQIPKPAVDVQRELVAPLVAIERRINLLRETNATLESIAQALFKSWFIDFDPVRAKAEGRKPEGMDAATAALFPVEFEESALGLIPKGWEWSDLGAVCAKTGGWIQTGPFGSQLHASDYKAEGIPVVMPQDMHDRRISEQRIARISQEDADRLSKHKLKPGDIVFSRRGDVGRHATVSKLEEGWLCGTGCLLVRPGSKMKSTAFLSRALAQPASSEWLVRHAVGATMPNLNTGILASVPMVGPSEDVLHRFEQVVAALEHRISLNHAHVKTLSGARDTLLPRLISGELRLTEAEAQLEAAAE